MLTTMRVLSLASMCVLFAAACGDGDHRAGPPADAGIDAPADAPIDDPPPQATVLTADDGVDAVPDWSFADTSVGARAGVTLFLNNAGTIVTQALGASIVGDGFAIDTAGSSCNGTILVPGARCSIALVFAPTSAGSVTAKLHVTGGGGALDFALHGTSVAAPAGIVADAGTLNFGVVEVDTRKEATVQVSNPGTGDVTLAARTATGGFVVIDNCPATLSAGAACTLHVALTPSHNGVITGALSVPSSANTLTIRLRAVGARQVRLDPAGAGEGFVVSVPPGIACGTSCSALFTGGVALIATPGADNFFTGWGVECGVDKVCVLPAQSGNVLLTPTFQPPTAKRIDVTFAGEAAGFVYIVDATNDAASITCTASCTTFVASGDEVTVYAYTPSTFSGWSGACTATSHDCGLGTVIANRAVTATFDRDERELTTLFPRAPVTGLTMMPNGDVVIADAMGVTRMDLTGAVAWTHAFDGGAHDLASDAAGNTYGGSVAGLFKLGPDGALLWTRPVTVGKNPQQSVQSTVSASPDGTVIAALSIGGVEVVDGNGDGRFATTQLSPDGMAVAPDGTVAVGVSGQPEQLDILRFTASGTPLTTLSPLPGESDASLVYDAQNFLCAQTTTFGTDTMVRVAPDLTLAFSHAEPTHLQPSPRAATVVTSSGEVVAVRSNDDEPESGLNIEAFSPTGEVTWRHVKVAEEQLIIFFDGIRFTAAATDTNHHLAVAGNYSDAIPVIQVFTMP
jgi:hypothetical protein